MTKTLESSVTPRPPAGWWMSGSEPEHYEAGSDTSVAHSGTRSAYMKHSVEQPEEFATLMQEMSAENYLGKRLRMTGWLKTEQVQFWASLWMSVYGEAGRINVSFDNMCERKVTGTSDWTKYEIVLDVPDSATKIGFGAILSGEGKLWFDDVAFDVVGNDVRITDCPCSERRQRAPEALEPSNLNFEES